MLGRPFLANVCVVAMALSKWSLFQRQVCICSSCASLVTSTTALERDKTIGGSTWTQYNNSEYADLSSFTSHQNYPALETDKAIGRCTNERGKTLPKAGGKSLPRWRWPPGLLTNKHPPHREGGCEFSLLQVHFASRLVKRQVANAVFIFAKL